MKGSSLPTSWPEAGSIGSRANVQKLAMVIARWERQNGAQIEDTTLQERYAALMPDLGETLSYARQIAAAARTTRRADSSADPASASAESQPLGPVIPGYEITETIDHGGQGLIYKAIQHSTNRVVALKLPLDGPLSSERQCRRFTREVEIISRLSHPNIVPLLDSGTAHGRQYFAMEYIDGLPIDDYFLLNRGSLDGLVTVFDKVCRAVASAHQHGVIHRDLKPGNILVDRQGEPHILDFGLAKEFGDGAEDEPASLLSHTGQILGTLPYLSPEQAAGEPQIDVRADIYSLGVMLYELVTGAPPYDTTGDPEVVRRNIRFAEPRGFDKAGNEADRLLSTVTVPNDLQRVILKALSKEKSRRYQSTVEFADDLARFLRGEAVAAKADSRLYVLRKALKRYRTQAVIAACFLVVLVGAAVGMGVMWLRADRLAKKYQKGLELGSYLHMTGISRDEGRVDDAINMLQIAGQIGVDINDRDDRSVRFAFETHRRLAELLIDKNRLSEAQEQAKIACDLAEAKLRQVPNDSEWRLFNATAIRTQGREALSRRDYENALKCFTHSTTLFETLSHESPDNKTVLTNLASAYQTQGEVCRALGQRENAFKYCDKAIGIYERLCREAPKSAEFAINLAQTKISLAACHIDQRSPDHYDEALTILTKVSTQLDQLVRENPRHGLTRDVDRLKDAIAGNRQLVDRRRAAVAISHH